MLDAHGPGGAPFVGEAFTVQSPDQPTGPRDRGTGWTCTVDAGDGTAADGHWRAKPWSPQAPCARSHTYASPGRHTITLTVTDDLGRSTTSTQEVEVVDRPVEVLGEVAEGSVLPLPVPASGGSWRVVGDAAARCAVEGGEAGDGGGGGPGGAEPVLRCHDDGPARLHLDATDGSESRAVDTAWRNVAPAPGPVRLERWRADGSTVPLRGARTGASAAGGTRAVVVRTGDQVLLRVPHGDPGSAVDPAALGALRGDDVTCRTGFGDGTAAVSAAYGPDCTPTTAWQRPGTFRVTTTATDDDGATSRATSRVRVVLRPVSAAVRGRLDDGSSVSGWARLRRAGTRGVVRLVTAEGRVVRAAGRPRVSVVDGAVTWTTPVRVDGQRGYRASVTVPAGRGRVEVVVWGAAETVLVAGGAREALRAQRRLGR
nr:PKD domain-containing protein [Nocardioides perillae]